MLVLLLPISSALQNTSSLVILLLPECLHQRHILLEVLRIRMPERNEPSIFLELLLHLILLPQQRIHNPLADRYGRKSLGSSLTNSLYIPSASSYSPSTTLACTINNMKYLSSCFLFSFLHVSTATPILSMILSSSPSSSATSVWDAINISPRYASTVIGSFLSTSSKTTFAASWFPSCV